MNGRAAWVPIVARWVLGGVFVYMGVAKIADPVAFLKAIRQFGVVEDTSPTLLNLAAALLPWVEVWCGLLLVAGVAVRGTVLTLCTMLIVFTWAITMRAQDIHGTEGTAFCAIAFDCGCGGGIVNVCRKLTENTGLVLLGLLVLFMRSDRLCLRRSLLAPRR
ncbi:MAG: MauE/DoxX family redox-associated membrane protein [Planctomycetota bacterium]